MNICFSVNHTLNKKSLNGPGNSMFTVRYKNFLVDWRNSAATVSEKLCLNRRVSNCVLVHGLNSPQLTQEKEKSSVDRLFARGFNIFY